MFRRNFMEERIFTQESRRTVYRKAGAKSLKGNSCNQGIVTGSEYRRSPLATCSDSSAGGY